MKTWNDCVAFHGHECGGLTIGYKASLYAIALLELEFSADEQVNNRHRQYDNEENDSRRRCERGISARIAVKHIVNISNDCIHFRNV